MSAEDKKKKWKPVLNSLHALKKKGYLSDETSWGCYRVNNPTIIQTSRVFRNGIPTLSPIGVGPNTQTEDTCMWYTHELKKRGLRFTAPTKALMKERYEAAIQSENPVAPAAPASPSTISRGPREIFVQEDDEDEEDEEVVPQVITLPSESKRRPKTPGMNWYRSGSAIKQPEKNPKLKRSRMSVRDYKMAYQLAGLSSDGMECRKDFRVGWEKHLEGPSSVSDQVSSPVSLSPEERKAGMVRRFSELRAEFDGENTFTNPLSSDECPDRLQSSNSFDVWDDV
jgi:hypothetical protein